jgi:type I restriction enzyme M protein
MSAFDHFTNPFKEPASVPENLRRHPSLRKLFKVDGSYVRPAEDPVTLWAVDILHRDYKVPLEAMELELAAQFSRGYAGRADVVIFDDRYRDGVGNMDVAFIMVEAMEPGKKFGGVEPEGWNEHFERLNAYMSQSPSARYAVLTSGVHTIIYRRDLEYPRALEEIPNLAPYESAAEAAKHSPFTVVLNPKEPDGIETHLQPLTREKFREVLGDTRTGCHSILRDNEGLQPQEAVDAMVKFLFAKWYDEQATIDLVKATGQQRAYVFSIGSKTDPERLLVQVRETFEQAKAWERNMLSRKFGADLAARLAFTENDHLQFKPHTTMQIVERLQKWSLRQSSADVKGGVFEDFLSKTFRDDLGQYFTPTPVINLMVGILQPTVDDFIGDPACGSARMLTHALEYVRKQEFAKAVAANGGSQAGIDPDEPSDAFIRFRDNNLFGAEISRNVMHVARVNCLMNGAQYADLKVLDSLERMHSITGGLNDRPGFYPGGLSMILTNPPFGSKVTSAQVLKDYAGRGGVSLKEGKVMTSLPQEVVFVNRCLEFLAPGGKLAIVLPDGVLANDAMQDVRNWILRWARLKAVVSLPQETFAPFGAGVKASVVVLQKREKPLTAEGQLRLGETVTEAIEDYQVYMARIDNIGYDATGRLTVSEDKTSFPPEITETVEDFQKRLGWKY